MTTSLHLTLGEGLSMREALAATFGTMPLVCLKVRAWAQLVDEFGGDYHTALGWLLGLVEQHQQPVALNLPRGEDSTTVLLGPKTWSQERLTGWMAGLKDELEAEFGEVSRIGRFEP